MSAPAGAGARATAAALIGAHAADLALGDPARRHPVAGFGRLAALAERAVYAPSRARGAGYALGMVGLAALAGELASRAVGRPAALLALTWASLGGRSLCREARRIAAAVDAGEIAAARAALPALAGRDAGELDRAQLCRAVVESVAENTADAVVGTHLWAALGGPAGVAAHRAANTLDAMVGHRSERHARFGWAAARLDDALGWPAARLGAVLAVAWAPLVGGSPRAAWRVLRRDGGAHPSPNAGRLEAAFAGALGVRLGGELRYGGRLERRAQLGDGPPPGSDTVRAATTLSLAVGASAAALCAAARAAWERRR